MKRQLSKRESTIRIGGIFMLAAPFFNVFLAIALSSGIPNKWGLSGLKLLFNHMPTLNWFLYASSLVVGWMMIKGRRASWAFVLVVLGIYIMYGGVTLYHDIRSHDWQPVFAMSVNIGLFVVVYLQEFHQQVHGLIDDAMAASIQPAVAEKKPEPLAFTLKPEPPTATDKPLFNPIPLRTREVSLKLPLLVDLTGVGTWAKLVSVSADEICMESLSWLTPDGIESKMIEIDLPTTPDPVTLRARFVRHSGSTYTFEIIENKFAIAA